MCPDCQRVEKENHMLQLVKAAAERLIGILHIEYTGETRLNKLIKRAIDDYQNEVDKGVPK